MPQFTQTSPLRPLTLTSLDYAPTQSQYVGSANEEYKALFDKTEKNYLTNRSLADLSEKTLEDAKVSPEDIQHKKAVQEKVKNIFSTMEQTGMWDRADEMVRDAAKTISSDVPFKKSVEDYARKEEEQKGILARTDLTMEDKLQAINYAKANDKGIKPLQSPVDGSVIDWTSTWDMPKPAESVDGGAYGETYAKQAKAEGRVGNAVYDPSSNKWRSTSDLVTDGQGNIRTTPDGKYVFTTEKHWVDKNELIAGVAQMVNQNPKWQAYQESKAFYVNDNDNSPAHKSDLLAQLKALGADTNDYKNKTSSEIAKAIYKRQMTANAVKGLGNIFGYMDEKIDKFDQTKEGSSSGSGSGKTPIVPESNYLATYTNYISNPDNQAGNIAVVTEMKSQIDVGIQRDHTTLYGDGSDKNIGIYKRIELAEASATPDLKTINFLKRQAGELETQIAEAKNEKERVQYNHDKSLEEAVAEFNTKKKGLGDELAKKYNSVFNPDENKANPTINAIVDKTYEHFRETAIKHKWHNVTDPSSIYDIPLAAFKDIRASDEIKKTLREKLIRGEGTVEGVGTSVSHNDPMTTIHAEGRTGIDPKLVADYRKYYKSLNDVSGDLGAFKDAINEKMADKAENIQVTPGMVDLSAGDGNKNSEFSKLSKYAQNVTQFYANNKDGWVMFDDKTGQPISYDYKTGTSSLPDPELVDITGMTGDALPGHGYLVTATVYQGKDEAGKVVRVPNTGTVRLLKPSSGDLSNIYNLAINEATQKGMYDYAENLKQRKVDNTLAWFDNFPVKEGELSTKYAIRNSSTNSTGNLVVTRQVNGSGQISYLVKEDPKNTKGLGENGNSIGQQIYTDRTSVERALEYVEQNVSPLPLRTDRHHNPIAFSVLQGQKNSMTDALDAQGIKWTYGSPFKGDNNQTFNTVNIVDENKAYDASITAIENGGFDWYKNKADYGGATRALEAAGIKSVAEFKALPQVEKIKLVKAIAKQEGSGLYN